MERDYSAFRPVRVWKRLSAEQRLAVADAFWRSDSTEQQVEAVGAIAAHMKFRPKSVLNLPHEKRAKYLAVLPTITDTIASRALIDYHLERQRSLMGAFLDALGIAHEDGLIADDNVTRPDSQKLRDAAAELAAKHPPEDVALYLSTLVSQDPDTWGELAELPQTATVAARS